jgi:hypothetical protein
MAAANPAKAISIAGLTCGAMDISAALVVYGLMGSKPLRLLQGIAGGILGPRTYSGGTSTALLGLALHFVIAFGAATVFFLASRVVPLLLNNPGCRRVSTPSSHLPRSHASPGLGSDSLP